MTLSIYEALQLPIMSNTKLVAGAEGLNNLIKWVTVVEVIEDIDRLQEGELLITTGFGLLKNAKKYQLFIKLLSMKKLSGVAIYTGFYLHEIPEVFIETANENNLPLVEIPININFSMITKELLEQIVNRQMQLFEYSLDIHNRLTSLVLANKGISPITKTLSTLIDGSVVIFNEFSEITSTFLIHDNMQTEDNLIEINQEVGILSKDELHEYTKLKQSIFLDKKSFKMMVCPIIANETKYGFILAFKETDYWNDLDVTAVEYAATVYAIEFIKKAAVEDTQLRLQGEFLEDIINKNLKSASVALERGNRLGYDLSKHQAIFYFKFDYKNIVNTSFKDFLNRLYSIIQYALNKKQKQYILRNKFDALFLLTAVEGISSEEKRTYCINLAKIIEEKWREYYPHFPLQIGIGKTYKEIHHIGQSAREAEYAATFSKLLLKPRSIVHYDDLGLYHLLIKMNESNINLEQFYKETLGPLIKHHSQGADWIKTLETYLTNNQSIQATASHLFIHRHTLKYRLKQIEKKTGLDLDSADDRMKLHLAIMAYKLLTISD